MTTIEGTAALAAVELGKRYRRGWALRDCAFELPAGRVAALIGPNGAGKSTLMALTTGLITPTTGRISVFGAQPGRGGTHRMVAFLGQDKPLYRRFTVAEMLRAGAKLNPRWDSAYAHRLVREANVPLHARIRTLSGGQRTRVALAMALGRRPELLVLDEPLADLDPLARQEVMRTITTEASADGMTVVLSSHVIADLDGVCDHLLVLAEGRVRLAGAVGDLLRGHRLLIGPRPAGPAPFPSRLVVESRVAGQHMMVLLRAGQAGTDLDPPGWEVHEPGLEELTLAYLRQAGAMPAGHAAAVVA